MKIDNLVLLGCGKMGSALLKGWIDSGISLSVVSVLEPKPTQWLENLGARINPDVSAERPDVCVIAVKPQMMPTALDGLKHMGNGNTMILSIAAGTTITHFENTFGPDTPVVRAMPNTPAAIGWGISAFVGNSSTGEWHMQLAEQLLSAVGQTVRLQEESDIDIVTGVSGSGPAYVFHMIECLASSGKEAGLPPDIAMKLAIETVAGAGQLARESGESPAQLRINVTSPAGTTEAGLKHLMNPDIGLQNLIDRTVTAAIDRSRELGSDD